MAVGRGVSWKQEEVMDLLAIWGEWRVQMALRESHQNKDIFYDVLNGMVERGVQVYRGRMSYQN